MTTKTQTAAERAAEAIRTDVGIPLVHRESTQRIAAIIAKEYAELEKKVEWMLINRLVGDGNEYSDRYWKTDVEALRYALQRVRGQK